MYATAVSKQQMSPPQSSDVIIHLQLQSLLGYSVLTPYRPGMQHAGKMIVSSKCKGTCNRKYLCLTSVSIAALLAGGECGWDCGNSTTVGLHWYEQTTTKSVSELTERQEVNLHCKLFAQLLVLMQGLLIEFDHRLLPVFRLSPPRWPNKLGKNVRTYVRTSVRPQSNSIQTQIK